ncbi:MAG: MarR family transcriptional regulator [Clostridia bacterium]|nr:MarR family transcriptional regulator [Clostridia bacterium]
MENIQSDTRCESICLRNQICFPLYACAKEVIRQYRKPLEALNLTYTQYIVMMVLWEQGDMTESELGHTLRLDSGTLTPLLKRLEKQGLIVRTHPQSRERKLFLSLTEKGMALRDRALEVPEQMHGCIDLPTEELMQLKTLLDKALSRMGRTRT